jgi:hypothetical protein
VEVDSNTVSGTSDVGVNDGFVELSKTFTTGADRAYAIISFYNNVVGNIGYADFAPYSLKLEEVSTITAPSASKLYPKVTAVSSDDNIDQSQVTSAGTSNLGNGGGNQKEGQSFIPTKKNLTALVLRKGANVGSPTFNISISIQADNAGSPSGIDLGTPVTITAAQWDATTDNTDYTVNYPLTLTPLSSYWIVYTPSSQGDASNYRKNSISGNTNPYANGGIKHFNGSVWSSLDTSYDYYFKTLYRKNTTNFTVRTDTETMSVTAPTTDGWDNGTVIDTTVLDIQPLDLASGVNNIYYSSNGPATADGTVDPSLQYTIVNLLTTNQMFTVQEAANRWAGTVGLTTQEALNVKNSSTEAYTIQEAVNKIAGT